MASQIEIKKSKLIVAEGADAYWFLIWACQAFGISDIQVMDFGGITELTQFLKTVSLLPQYETVKTIVIARDAETDPVAAMSSILHSLQETSLPVPSEPFQFIGNGLRVAFMIFPGFEFEKPDSQKLIPGTLENLCLEIANDKSTYDCVNGYIHCLKSLNKPISHHHKTQLHAYLSGQDAFVGLKIGEAAKAGAWDWNHPQFAPFRTIISNM